LFGRSNKIIRFNGKALAGKLDAYAGLDDKHWGRLGIRELVLEERQCGFFSLAKCGCICFRKLLCDVDALCTGTGKKTSLLIKLKEVKATIV
jgi:hypothetical protein